MAEQTRILVVEDEGITAEEIKGRLEQMGHRVCAMAITGQEAIALAEKLSPDLIIMDIKLKGRMDGITAAGKIKENLDVPVIFLTANAGEAIFDRARLTGPDAFISKPYTPLDLGYSIEIALTKHRMEAKLRESETRYRRLVEDMPSMMCRFDGALKLTLVNHATSAFFGVDREELLGSGYLKYVPEKERKPMIDAVRSLTAENSIVKIEHLVALPDGRTRWLRWTIRYLREAEGAPSEYQSIGEDITDIRRLEGEVIRIAEEERREISQDLHDDLGQKLSYLGFLAEM
ncbi:MAG: response regulator [Spirochaetes bacterium]|nr:response regulator [Spirochaetota bacterium]